MENIPQYRQLYEVLRKHIETGVYEEGNLLPSENELCMVHGMTRPTVRHALDSLVKDRLILKKQGKGSIVRKPPQNIGILSIAGTASAIGVSYLKTDILQKPVIKSWPASFPFELSELEKEAGCVYMERLRYVDDAPVFYDINHVPNLYLPRITNLSFENKSLFEILRKQYRIEILGGEQKLKAIKPEDNIKKLLQLKKDQPVLHIERKLFTNKEGFSIYSTTFELSELEKEAGCVYMERLRYVDDAPVFYDINHLPNIYLPRITNRSFENKSLFEILRKQYRIEILGGEQKLKAIKPEDNIKKLLQLKKDQPVLHIERKLFTNKEGFSIYSTIYFNSEKHSIFGSF